MGATRPRRLCVTVGRSRMLICPRRPGSFKPHHQGGPTSSAIDEEDNGDFDLHLALEPYNDVDLRRLCSQRERRLSIMLTTKTRAQLVEGSRRTPRGLEDFLALAAQIANARWVERGGRARSPLESGPVSGEESLRLLGRPMGSTAGRQLPIPGRGWRPRVERGSSRRELGPECHGVVSNRPRYSRGPGRRRSMPSVRAGRRSRSR